VSINELGLLPAARLNERHGLGGVSSDAVSATRDKAEMRRRLEGTPLAWPYFVAENGDADPGVIAEAVGLPCVAKPCRGTASKGVKFIPDLANLTRYVESAKSHRVLGGLIFESHIPGKEYSLEAFSLNGETRIYGITHKTSVDAIEIGHGLCNSLLRRHGPACQEAIDLLLARLGIRTGPTHTEVKIGPDGTVRVVETHTRVGGSFLPELLRVVTGVDLYALTVQEACGALRALPEPEERQIAAAIKYKQYDLGKVVSMTGDSNLRFRPDILYSSVTAKPGIVLRRIESNLDRSDFVACHAPTLGDAYARCDHYLARLEATTAPVGDLRPDSSPARPIALRAGGLAGPPRTSGDTSRPAACDRAITHPPAENGRITPRSDVRS
jgi:ATP-grasp domain/L-amino acid ligase C-terminal domain 2